jgi:hypothetical protein
VTPAHIGFPPPGTVLESQRLPEAQPAVGTAATASVGHVSAPATVSMSPRHPRLPKAPLVVGAAAGVSDGDSLPVAAMSGSGCSSAGSTAAATQTKPPTGETGTASAQLRAAAAESNAPLWWLTPPGVVLMVVPVSLLLAWLYPDETYRQAWSTAKSLDTDTVRNLAIAAMVFVVAALATMLFTQQRALTGRWPALTPRALALLRRAHWWLFAGTLFGYIALMAAGLSRGARPADLLARLVGAPVSADALKEQFAPVTGVTSLTQLGIGFVIVTTFLLLADPNRGLMVRMGVVLGLGLLRAFLLSERLAILELVLPLLAVVAMAAMANRTLRPALRALPAVLLPLGVALFALFEFGRSWSFYRSRTGGSFLEFAGERFAGYYATAYNNGQLLISHSERTADVPYLSIQGIWEAPGVAQLGLYERVNDAVPVDWLWLLGSYGNPEFNNQCGVCVPVGEFGAAGAAVFFAAVGVLVTLTFVGFTNAHPVGLLVYPVLFTGLWELPRYLYWTQGRLLPVLMVLLVLGVVIARAQQQQVQVQQKPQQPRQPQEQAQAQARLQQPQRQQVRDLRTWSRP